MSHFTPLNVLADELEDAEEHLRELQVQEGLASFQQALELHASGDLQAAHEAYLQVAELEVVWGEGIVVLPQIRQLRFLVFRNRGMVCYAIGRAGGEVDARAMVSDMLAAVEYGDGDLQLLKALQQTCVELGLRRVAKLVLEFEMEMARRGLRGAVAPSAREVQQRYRRVCNHDESLPEEVLAFLAPLREHRQEAGQGSAVPTVYQVPIREWSWSCVVAGVAHLLPTRKGGRDPYWDTADTVEVVEFVEIGEDVKEEQMGQGEGQGEGQQEGQQEGLETERSGEQAGVKQEPSDSVKQEDQEGEAVDTELLEKPKPTEETALQAPQEEAKPAAENGEELSAEPAQGRLRRRAAAVTTGSKRSTPPERDDFGDTQKFLTTFNTLLAEVGVETSDVLLAFLNELPTPTYLRDLVYTLSHWGEAETRALVAEVDENNTRPLMDVLMQTAWGDYGGEAVVLLEEAEPAATVQAFVASLATSGVHVHQVRMLLVERLLETPVDGVCLATDSAWAQDTLGAVKGFIQAVEMDIYTRARGEAWDGTLTLSTHSVAVAMCEFLTDWYLLLSRGSAEQTHNSDRLHRWLELALDMTSDHPRALELHLRLEWCQVALHQQPDYRWTPHDKEQRLQRFLDQVVHASEAVDVAYANHRHLPRLNSASVQGQVSKTNLLSRFLRILEGDSDSGGAVFLEKVLVPAADEPLLPMALAVAALPLEVRLLLWERLLQCYRTNESEYARGFAMVMEAVLEELLLERYTQISPQRRRFTLLGAVRLMLGIVARRVECVQQRGWRASANPTSLPLLVQLMQLGYMYALHTHASDVLLTVPLLKSQSAPEQPWRVFLVHTATLVAVQFREQVDGQADAINDLVSVLHTQLGALLCCDAGGGAYLEMSQNVLLQVDWKDLVMDMCQVLSCRFHDHISLVSIQPYDHGTEAVEMDADTACRVARYLLPLCFTKNPALAAPKSDIKDALGRWVELAEGDAVPGYVAHNHLVLTHFMELGNMDTRAMRQAMHGVLGVDLAAPSPLSAFAMARCGGYYVQGAMALAVFRVRKRLMQLRTVELDYVVKMLMLDLVYGLRRVELWWMLAQLFGFLVEDDMIWTSDKLNGERKNATALVQKKALMCYLMAVSEFVHQRGAMEPLEGFTNFNYSKNDTRQVAAQLWLGFAKELYNAVQLPMGGLCFKVAPQPRFVRGSDGLAVVRESGGAMPSLPALHKVALQAFQIAVSMHQRDWTDHYYLAKIMAKLGYDPAQVMQTIIRACELSRLDKSAEPLGELHYRLIAQVYKYVKLGVMTRREGLEWMARGPGIVEREWWEGSEEEREGSEEEVKAEDGVDGEQTGTAAEQKPEEAEENTETTTAVGDSASTPPPDSPDVTGESPFTTAPSTPHRPPARSTTSTPRTATATPRATVPPSPTIASAVSASEDISFSRFVAVIIRSLKRMIAADKKKWLHRTRFKLARIYLDDMDDAELAFEEMLQLVLLKTTNKNLVTIWKPEAERPGKHFQYASDYALFFVSLLERRRDLALLCVFYRKLRKLHGAMLRLGAVWEATTAAVCVLVREALGISDKFSEYVVQATLYHEFVVCLKALMEEMADNAPIAAGDEQFACLLVELAELRRLNNGFGSPTAQIEDTFVLVFLKMYLRHELRLVQAHRAKVQLSTAAVLLPKRVPRITRKDLIPKCTELVRLVDKQVQALVRERGDEIYRVRRPVAVDVERAASGTRGDAEPQEAPQQDASRNLAAPDADDTAGHRPMASLPGPVTPRVGDRGVPEAVLAAGGEGDGEGGGGVETQEDAPDAPDSSLLVLSDNEVHEAADGDEPASAPPAKRGAEEGDTAVNQAIEAGPSAPGGGGLENGTRNGVTTGEAIGGDKKRQKGVAGGEEAGESAA